MKLEPHPMAGASLIEVMDYLALRLAEVRDVNADDRNLRNASDRYDEAYMWVVAWVSSQAAVAAPAVDAVPAGEVERLARIRTSMALLQQNSEGCALNHYGDDATLHGMPGWLIDTKADLDAFTDILAAFSHGEGRK